MKRNLVFTIMVCTFSIVPCLRNYSLVQDIKCVLLHFLINSFHLMFMVLISIIFHLKSKFPWHHLWNWSSFPPWFAVPSFSFIFHVPIYLGIILSLMYLWSICLLLQLFSTWSLQFSLWAFKNLFSFGSSWNFLAFQVTVLNSFINVGFMKLETICISWVFKSLLF